MAAIWWDTTKPGAGTANLTDAETPKNSDNSSGVVGRHRDILWVCERSGFIVPFDETVLDPVSGRRVWFRFADEEVPTP